jgi:hypothetical protein
LMNQYMKYTTLITKASKIISRHFLMTSR